MIDFNQLINLERITLNQIKVSTSIAPVNLSWIKANFSFFHFLRDIFLDLRSPPAFDLD